MLARTWRGFTKAEDVETYLAYVERTGLQAFRDTPGNLGAMMLVRLTADGRAELQIVSFWESMDAVRAFAGPQPERAVFFPEDARYLVERDDWVEHFDAVYARWPGHAEPSASTGSQGGAASDVGFRPWWEWLARVR